ncbi:MAG: class I SAM-dependent RNA methyltransferase, partial [Deltaproteobacteria bacterium]|nr:class I SAM-dependent RNA methyltransferase [Deltaproteobacteria bacterium]
MPRAVVGDELLVRVEKEKKRYIIGSLEEVVKAAPERCQPPCQHYDECGGCDLLQLSYSDQVDLKKEMLIQVLAGAKILMPVSIVAAPDEKFYRHRAIFHCDREARVGFLQRRSHQVVSVPNCLVLAPGLKKMLLRLGENPELLSGGLSSCYAISNSRGDVAAIGCRGHFHRRNLKAIKSIPKTVVENYGFGDLELAAAGFAQVNPQIISIIIRDLIEHCADTDTVAELYGGSGTFSLPLAQVVKQVTVYESDASAAERGRRNAGRNNLENIHFISTRVEKVEFSEPLDIMVVDPPRIGLSAPVIEKIGQSRARKLIYISCNPATLARDLSRLKSLTNGFTLDSIKAYDMYP